MNATLVIKNIDNLITLEGENKARTGKEQGEITIIKNGIIVIAPMKSKLLRVLTLLFFQNLTSSTIKEIATKAMRAVWTSLVCQADW